MKTVRNFGIPVLVLLLAGCGGGGGGDSGSAVSANPPPLTTTLAPTPVPSPSPTPVPAPAPGPSPTLEPAPAPVPVGLSSIKGSLLASTLQYLNCQDDNNVTMEQLFTRDRAKSIYIQDHSSPTSYSIGTDLPKDAVYPSGYDVDIEFDAYLSDSVTLPGVATVTVHGGPATVLSGPSFYAGAEDEVQLDRTANTWVSADGSTKLDLVLNATGGYGYNMCWNLTLSDGSQVICKEFLLQQAKGPLPPGMTGQLVWTGNDVISDQIDYPGTDHVITEFRHLWPDVAAASR